MTTKRAGRYPLGGFFFAAVPCVLAVSGLVLRLVSGASQVSESPPQEAPPSAVEVVPTPTAELETLVPMPPPPAATTEQIIREYSEGRISSARALARSAEHAELLATLDEFEHHYTLGLEARAAGQRDVALQHLQECLALDKKLTNGRSNSAQRLKRQIASLRPKTSRSKR